MESLRTLICQPLEKIRPTKISPIPNKKNKIFPPRSGEFPPNMEKRTQSTPHSTAIPDPLIIGLSLMFFTDLAKNFIRYLQGVIVTTIILKVVCADLPSNS